MGAQLFDRALVLRLEHGLAGAAANVRAARVRAASGCAAGRAAWAVGGTAAAVAGVLAAGRLTAAAPAGAAACVTAVGLLASAAVAGITLAGAWQRRPDLSDVAERLDLAAADHNAVATALELSRRGARSPFDVRAIAAGVEALRLVASGRPIEPDATGTDHRLWTPLAAGGVALALSLLVPARGVVQDAVGGPRAVPIVVTVHRTVNAETRRPPPPPPRVPTDVGRPGALALSRTAVDSGRSTEVQASVGPALESAASVSSGVAAARVARTADGASSPPRQRNGQPPGGDGRPPEPAGSPVAGPGRPMWLASSGAAAAEVAQARGTADGGAAGQADDDAAAPAQAEHLGGGVGSLARASEATAPKATGAGDGPGTGAAKPPGNAGGRSLSTGLDASGNGQSGGQNSPKKSRGVAPLLLATPEPDLFQGKSLPGPEERTRLTVKGRSAAGAPAPAVAAAPRRDDEPPVAAFQVPADLRQVVESYFERFHQEADPVPATPLR